MRKKLLSILLSLCMLLLLLPINAVASETDFSDMPAENFWSYEALMDAVENGLLKGDSGKLMPRESLTRAQLAAILNRAFGAEETTDISGYSDVNVSAWYYADIAKAVRMGTLLGSGSGTMRPDDPVTRQEAFVVLARAIKLTGHDTAALDIFSDKADISTWAALNIAAMVQAGYVNGSNGKLNPAGAITREQFAQVIHNMLSLYISRSGTYTENINGNVLISSANVTLKGITLTGDLILGEGVGNGDVTLDGVTLTGRLVIRAGGENSIHIINKSGIGSIIVGKTGDGGLRIRTEEGCRVDVVYVDDGVDDVILEGSFNQITVSTDAPVVLKDATVTGLTVSGKSAVVKLEGSTTVSVTQITENAAGATIEVGAGARVTKVESIAQSVTISGSGTVTQAVISGDNSAVNTPGTKVTTEVGTTGVTQNGKAIESGASAGGSTGSSSDEDSYSYTAAVTTLQELQAALSNTSVSAITIRGSITIPEGTTVTFSKPVTIADLPDAMLIVSGGIINNSTFTNRGMGGFFNDTGIALDGSFVNNGAFENASRFGMCEAVFTNNGTVNNKSWLHCGGTAITNNGTFTSMGDITLLNSDSFEGEDHAASTFTNASGATLMSEGPGGIQVRKTCSFTNAGTVTSHGYFENYGTLTNTGSFTYTHYMINTGTITGALTESGDDAKLENDRPVSSLEDLKAQLTSLDSGFDGIAITGDIALTEDLTISHYVVITPDGTFTVPSGYKLTVSSVSGYNELKVSGKLDISGTLETTRTGEGESEAVGQITIVGGALRAFSGCTITNSGIIMVIRGEADMEDGITYTGNYIFYLPSIAEVTNEDELQSAMSDPEVEEVIIEGDITLTSDLDITKNTTVTYDDHTASQRTLTVSPGATVTVKDGGSLSILGSVVNNGTFTDSATGNGVFIGSYGSFINSSTGILNVDNRFDILEGTLENSGSVSISAGDNHTILCMGAVVTNKTADAVFTNEGALDMGTSIGKDGAVYNRGTMFTNAGTFNNGGISTPSSSAYFGMMSGTFTNTGDFVNNGQMDINYTSFTHTGDGSSFTTYNSRSLVITGGSLDTAGADGGSFTNEGYMRIIDEYGTDGGNNICAINLGDGTFVNGSNWLEYSADVYSEDGLKEAETAQESKKAAPAGNGFFDVYNRLDFKRDITLTGATELSSFGSYWIEYYWRWNDETCSDEKVSVTVTNEVYMAVSRNCILNVNGILVNNGTLVTAAPSDVETHEGCGSLDIWPEGTFTNNGTVTNDGDFYIRHEYDASDDDILQATVTDIGPVSAKFIAIVHNKDDLIAANSCDSPVYDRIEIKGDSIIELTGSGTLTIDKNVYIEPGSGLIVPYGKTLEFTGNHWVDNGGDISVYGSMSIGNGVSFNNNKNIDIGVYASSQQAYVTISSGGVLNNNDGNFTIYETGTLDASAGNYQGTAPNVLDGGIYKEHEE